MKNNTAHKLNEVTAIHGKIDSVNFDSFKFAENTIYPRNDKVFSFYSMDEMNKKIAILDVFNPTVTHATQAELENSDFDFMMSTVEGGLYYGN